MRFYLSRPRLAAIASLLLAATLSISAVADHVLITRSFSGVWDQPDHESQGLILQIGEAEDDSKLAVAYWFTYGEDLLSAWYLSVGPVEGHNIPMKLYRASGVEFMAEGLEGNPNVEEVGTLLLSFHNCNQGRAYFDTPEDVLGAGEFRIKRLTSIYHMRCSGGISDDTPGDAKPSKLDVALKSVRDDIAGDGKGMFWERSDRSDFKVEVEDMPDGPYSLEVCGEARGDFEVAGGEGSIEYRSPGVDSKLLLDFDPRNCLIEVIDEIGVALSSGDAVLAPKMTGPKDDNDGLEIEVDLTSTGIIEGAEGEAEYEMDDDEAEFSVEVENVPAGSYELWVDGIQRGLVEVAEDDGKFKGHLKFSDPVKDGNQLLDFDPRGTVVEVIFDGEVILETLFPDE